MTNQDYKNAALAALKGKWAPAVLATIVVLLLLIPYYAFSFGTVSISENLATDPSSVPSWYWILYGISLLYIFLIYVPFTVGYTNACKVLLVNGDDRITANSFKIGFARWIRNAWGYLLMEIKMILWMFLLFIPGIIKAFAYALTPYLLVDCPELTPLQCIKLSNKMMKGHKFDLFYLYLSFIGWGILGLLTLGIGYLWLVPYMSTATASFYEDVKAQYRAELASAAPAAPAAPAETPAAPAETTEPANDQTN